MQPVRQRYPDLVQAGDSESISSGLIVFVCGSFELLNELQWVRDATG